MAAETSTALKEALCAQQRLLQTLYNELDVEREASATAATETLAMIRRLQGEKAAVTMEAEQYKRLAEEKIYHAEESMEIFEELIHQKEMEIASLECQVQAYRYKLASLGFEDTGSNEINFPENTLQLDETSVVETSPDNILRRHSAPPKLLKLAYLKRCSQERKRSVSSDSDMIPRTLEESYPNLDSYKQTDGSSFVSFNSYWDQIQKLDKIVEEMAGKQSLSFKSRCSRSSIISQINEMGQPQTLKKSPGDMILSDSCSLSVHDVFEVPQTNEIVMNCEKHVKDHGKSILVDEKKVEEHATFPEGEKMFLLKDKDKQAFFPRDGIVIDCHMAIDLLPTDVTEPQTAFQVTNTTEITESASQDVRSEEQNGITGREEVLRLLHEINSKLDSIRSEITSGKPETKETNPSYDLPMLQLQEAMLHFWL